jgi:hypothetical protein
MDETKYKFKKYNRENFWFYHGKDVLTFIPSYRSTITTEMTITEIKEQGAMNICINGEEI